MNIAYILNARLPTEKAHGLAVMKASEALSNRGDSVELVVARRRNPTAGDPFEYYGIAEKFSITYLPCIDLYRFRAIPQKVSWVIQSVSFYASLFLWLIFRSRKEIIYTRDAVVCLASTIGFRTVFECHAVPSRHDLFFGFARFAERIVVVSATIERIIKSRLPKIPVLVCPNAVDLSIFDVPIYAKDARRELGIPLDSSVLLYTGNFTTYGTDKGIHDILLALPSIRDAVFYAVGGSATDIERYTAEAREAGITDRVVFIGRKPQKDLALYQKAADVLLMPFPDTEYYRNHMSPIKMFEYMASKRPIVATDLPTIREILTHENAVLVAPGDAKALALAVQKLLEDTQRGERLSRAAYEEVLAHTWSERAERIVAFIENGNTRI